MPRRMGLHRQRQVGEQVHPALVIGTVVSRAEGDDAGRVVTAPLCTRDDVGGLAWAATADKAGLILDRRPLGGARGGHRAPTWLGAGAGERGALHRGTVHSCTNAIAELCSAMPASWIALARSMTLAASS